MDYIKEVEKYLEIKENIKKLESGPYNAVLTNETEIEYYEDYGDCHLFHINFVFDSEKEYKEDEIINNCFYINILYEKKIAEFQKFIEDIKLNNFATICSDVDEEPYYYDYPERIIAYPYCDKVRFIVINCADCYSCEYEYIEQDLLFEKQEIIKILEKFLKSMKEQCGTNNP